MFGFRFIKTQPTQYVIEYRNGRPRREGTGLAFWYFAPSASIVAVPTGSANEPFIFPEVTADFQEVTVQGQITYRVIEPRRTAALLDFTLGPKGNYLSEDPQKLPQRLIDQVQVALRAEVQALPLKQVLAAGEALIAKVASDLRRHPTVDPGVAAGGPHRCPHPAQQLQDRRAGRARRPGRRRVDRPVR